MNKRLKEINELIYLKTKLIKETKKELKNLNEEKKSIITYKRLESQIKRKVKQNGN